MEAINVFDLENREDRSDVARAVGSTEMSMFLYELAPGRSARHSALNS
jgi:hypothetical protein